MSQKSILDMAMGAINERGINFVEADGGMWKLAARNAIKEHLEEHLACEVEDGAVVVAL